MIPIERGIGHVWRKRCYIHIIHLNSPPRPPSSTPSGPPILIPRPPSPPPSPRGWEGCVNSVNNPVHDVRWSIAAVENAYADEFHELRDFLPGRIGGWPFNRVLPPRSNAGVDFVNNHDSKNRRCNSANGSENKVDGGSAGVGGGGDGGCCGVGRECWVLVNEGMSEAGVIRNHWIWERAMLVSISRIEKFRFSGSEKDKQLTSSCPDPPPQYRLLISISIPNQLYP